MSLEIRIISSVVAPLIMLLGLTYFVATDKYILKPQKRSLLFALLIVASLIVSDILDFYLTYFYSAPTLRLINSTYEYITYPTLIVWFENIRVEYDIDDAAFSLPALTIQPIVENAIRHGVRIREEGIVRVSTRLVDGCHEISISDNGVGYDASSINGGDGMHIGINNVRERIEKLCRGTMTIESVPGKGTTVTFRIPQTEMK